MEIESNPKSKKEKKPQRHEDTKDYKMLANSVLQLVDYWDFEY